ncbi:MAG: DUF4234 domain-containing protein [Thermoleophilaceae bacterium]
MAQEVQIPGAGTTAKIRHPLGVIGLSLITLGIYGLFWWYFINREMADLGQANGVPELGDNPVLSVVALSIGSFIIIPPFVTWWRTAKRVETAQNRVLGSNNFSPVLAFVLIFIPIVGLISIYLIQSNLNQVWERGAQA